MPKLAVTLDTSPETLRTRTAASGAPKPPTPRSRWSPPTTPPEDTPLSPVSRLRRSITNAVSPILTRNRQSLPSQPIPLQTIVTDATTSASQLLPNPSISPLDRFRNAAFKVMQMNRLKRAMISMHDPGIDAGNPVTSKVLHNVRHENCIIDVMDYGVAHAKSTRLNNTNLEAFLAQPYRATAKHVRWINVSGISWDVISLLARQYGEFRLTPRSSIGSMQLLCRASPVIHRRHLQRGEDRSVQSRLLPATRLPPPPLPPPSPSRRKELPA